MPPLNSQDHLKSIARLVQRWVSYLLEHDASLNSPMTISSLWRNVACARAADGQADAVPPGIAWLASSSTGRLPHKSGPVVNNILRNLSRYADRTFPVIFRDAAGAPASVIEVRIVTRNSGEFENWQGQQFGASAWLEIALDGFSAHAVGETVSGPGGHVGDDGHPADMPENEFGEADAGADDLLAEHAFGFQSDEEFGRAFLGLLEMHVEADGQPAMLSVEEWDRVLDDVNLLRAVHFPGADKQELLSQLVDDLAGLSMYRAEPPNRASLAKMRLILRSALSEANQACPCGC